MITVEQVILQYLIVPFLLFVVLLKIVKSVAKEDAENSKFVCSKRKPCKKCTCGRGSNTGNLL